jgi:response regulator RpfG family c-di-GMP phosphodiesterase
MTKLVFTCAACSQPFSPVDLEKPPSFCRRRCCEKQRKRKRQRKWYKERYASDPAFKEAAKERVRQYRLRQLKKKLDVATAVTVAVTVAETAKSVKRVSRALLGLAAQIGADNDPAQAVEIVEQWADRGLRLSRGIPAGP